MQGIKKVAVLGAGVMGAQIAAHCANAGMETLLFDLAAKEGAPNGLVDKAIAHLAQLKPSPLAVPQIASRIQARNYEQHLPDLSHCDLVIEAIAERLDWKEKLYLQISPFLQKDTILVSNTSGLSVNALSQVLPEALRNNFCGLHFFNPPRYMHLTELIPADTTSQALLDTLETWLTSFLGKGVIRAKDTPNFIANRIGVFSLLSIVHHTIAMGMTIDEVDALTGPLLGRPKSASFRTMDVVGLDTMQHVVHTMTSQLTDDPWHAYFKLPDWMVALIKNGHLGQKTGQGFYKKNGKLIEVYDFHSGRYMPSNPVVSDEVQAIMKQTNAQLRMQQLMSSGNKQAQFLAACFKDLFHYCAYHLQTIADTVRDVDLAMRWGFGWTQGPFETWQLAGINPMIEVIQTHHASNVAPLPSWLSTIKVFYTEEGAYSPELKTYKTRSHLPVYKRQFYPDKALNEPSRVSPILYENEGLRLSLLKDDIAVVSFKSKANSLGQAVIDGMDVALDKAQNECLGLILYQSDAANFGSGADLRMVYSLIKENKLATLEAMVAQFQQLVMRLKYSTIPTIAALRGRAMGGTCELMMHCDAVVSSFEAYPGLVEIGVGLIPAGGGCKEMALRAAQSAKDTELMPFIQPFFQQIATGRVASSALDAIQMDYLKPTDTVVMHVNEVLYAAVAKIKAMLAANYLPPSQPLFKVAGIEGHAKLATGLVNWLEGGFISDYDYLLTDELAKVLCGGNVNQGTLVDEAWMLNLERETFIRLASNPLTQARIVHLLETGKPLRN